MHQNVTTVTDVTSLQSQAIDLLMAGQSHGNTARALGIHRQTLWRWRSLPSFAAVQAMQQQREQQRREELGEQLNEVLRLSISCLVRELKLGEDVKMPNPVDTAIKVFKAISHPLM